jgi:hypothetical protein
MRNKRRRIVGSGSARLSSRNFLSNGNESTTLWSPGARKARNRTQAEPEAEANLFEPASQGAKDGGQGGPPDRIARPTTAGTIRQLFGAAVKSLTQPAPKPKKSRRRRGGEDDKRLAFIRKHLRRLYRKIARDAGEDGGDGHIRGS